MAVVFAKDLEMIWGNAVSMGEMYYKSGGWPGGCA